MNSIPSILSELGLSPKEVDVYLACLELGTASVQEIAEKAGVKRTSIYNFLENMKKLGLLSEIKQGKKILLTAEDPNVLVDRAKSDAESARQRIVKMEQIVPELMGIYNLPGSKPKVWFYPGIEGIKKVYKDTYAHGSPIYGFADYDTILPISEIRDWLWKFADERKDRKVKFMAIVKDGEISRQVKTRDKEQLREVRLVKDVNFETEVNMYGQNRIALMSFRRPYSGVIIEDRAIYQTLLAAWKVWWELLK